MRLGMLTIISLAAFSAALTVESPDAKAAVVCVDGVHHHGCVVRPYGVGYRHAYGAVGVRGVARRTARRVGRRSDIRLKHDISLLGRLQNGLGFYRFVYNGGNKAFVGVIAQEVQKVEPSAVSRGSDGYLRVSYDQLGVKFQTYDRWIALGGNVPAGSQYAN